MKNKLPVKILAILLSCGLLTVGVGAAPVSYTHLDVYKRQLPVD